MCVVLWEVGPKTGEMSEKPRKRKDKKKKGKSGGNLHASAASLPIEKCSQNLLKNSRKGSQDTQLPIPVSGGKGRLFRRFFRIFYVLQTCLEKNP